MNRREIIATAGMMTMLPALARADTSSTGDLRGDVAILRQALALHPGLYRYNMPAAIELRLAALERDFVAAPDRAMRYLLLSRFLATIRCGHSYCNFFNQKKTVATELFDRPTRLPFQFRWIAGRMIVTAQGGPGLPPGTEVLRINDVATRDMLARLMPFARADGHNDAKRASLLSVAGNDSIEFFDVFHGLVFGAPPGGVHHCSVRLPNGIMQQRDMPAIGLARRRAMMTAQVEEGEGPLWDWTQRADGIAVLTMPTWVMFNSKWDWQAWLTDRLDSLTGAKGLIIDLRDNEGGNDCGNAILERLAHSPIRFNGEQRRIRFRRTPVALDPYLDTWDNSFRTLGMDATPIANGFFRLPPVKGVDSIAPNGARIALPVAALIGPANSSATFQFAALAKRSGTVRLFGETTGGNRRGINGGCFFFVRLPASGIEFDLPLIGYYPDTPMPDAGIVPDMQVTATARDIAQGRDPVLARAIDWIGQR